MNTEPPLPRYEFRGEPPGLWEMLRRGVADFPDMIPAAILDLPAVQQPGPGAPLVVADPVLVREVLNNRDGRFVRDRLMHRLFRRSWGQGLAGAEGEAWQRQRHAVAPAFRPQAVAGNAAAFARAAGYAAADWPLEEPIELTQQAARIIAGIVFAVLVSDSAVDSAAVAADMRGYVDRIARFGLSDLLPLPESWHDLLSGNFRDPAVRRVRALAQRLAAGRGHDGAPNDLVALLEGVGPIEDNIRGLFPAAMDTTMVGTSWTLYTLAQRPAWQELVAAEARSCGGDYALEALPLTRRVAQEVLRLYPPAPLLVRSSAADGKLGGFAVRKGQSISLHIYAMHRHRALWENPDAFDPDRFLVERGNHPGFLPFGFGPRSCVAAQFALGEIVAVVARLLSEFEFVTTGAKPQVTLRVSTRSANGLNVVARRRA